MNLTFAAAVNKGASMRMTATIQPMGMYETARRQSPQGFSK